MRPPEGSKVSITAKTDIRGRQESSYHEQLKKYVQVCDVQLVRREQAIICQKGRVWITETGEYALS